MASTMKNPHEATMVMSANLIATMEAAMTPTSPVFDRNVGFISNHCASLHQPLDNHANQEISSSSLPTVLLSWNQPPIIITTERPSISAVNSEERQLLSDAACGSSIQVSAKKSLRAALQVDHLSSSVSRPAFDSSPTLAAATRRQRVVGHRGALYDCLENTRESFRRCVDLKCDAVELDVFYLPLSNELVVFHGGGDDDNPGELTGYCQFDGTTPFDVTTRNNIADLTLAETQGLKFNLDNAEFPCPKNAIAQAKIPTLEQVLLDLKGTGCQVKIEFKGTSAVVEPVFDLVDRLDMTDQCVYSSFDHRNHLRVARALRPDANVYPTGALFDHPVPDNFVQLALDCGATQVHLPYDACTTTNIRQARAAGLTSMAWFRGPVGMLDDVSNRYGDIGNEDYTCYQAVLDTGVDELCVNRPDVLLNLLMAQSS